MNPLCRQMINKYMQNELQVIKECKYNEWLLLGLISLIFTALILPISHHLIWRCSTKSLKNSFITNLACITALREQYSTSNCSKQ